MITLVSIIDRTLDFNFKVDNYLTTCDKQWEDDGSPSYTEYSVYEETTEETKNDIWPRVPGVKPHKRPRVNF